MSNRRFLILSALLMGVLGSHAAHGAEPGVQAVVERFCINCHEGEEAEGELDLAAVLNEPATSHPEIWEKVIRRLRGRQMPPPGKRRPTEDQYAQVLNNLEGALDGAYAKDPSPGRTETIRRLTRTEYQNAIRDLLALDIDAAALLPADEASHGFDNVTVGNLSPTLLDRYVTAAQKISRTAVGGLQRVPGGETYRIPPDVTQEDRVEGLPLGTRGGALIRYTFPRDGEYEVTIRLARDRNEEVEGLRENHELKVLLDREEIKSFIVKPPPAGSDHQKVDAHLNVRLSVAAGPKDLGVTFLKNPLSLLENLRQPYDAHYNMHRHPRRSPAIYQVTITGPFEDSGVGETPSRQRIFVARPQSPHAEAKCAKQVLSTLMRRAYRRPVGESDLERIWGFYEEGRRDGDFDNGIEMALSAILVSPEFLLRVERDPAGVTAGSAYRISDVELASRLSFFLWSSIPDDELLALAERGELNKREILSQQTRRMLADARSKSLVTSFASQWLHLRNLDSITPDGRLFPDFDDNLRQALRRETELLFERVIREDRSVMDLLKADQTFLNERLARHYGIPHIHGDRFRLVKLEADSHRGGLLRHGSILTVTSYATRTSPVLRGKWILENLLGTPPKPPPADVPALEDNTVSASLPVRERLAEHRANAACASCHNAMDPVGLAMENFDAVGRWRELEEGQPVDASGGMPDGAEFSGVEGVEESLLKRPGVFAGTLTEKLMIYALGRGVESYDGPAVRGVVRAAQDQNYRFSSLIVGIVTSPPFTMRSTP